MQKEMCCGGESFGVHASSFDSLMKAKKIKLLPRQRNDAYWLTRYGT